jgi:hypothetical protein
VKTWACGTLGRSWLCKSADVVKQRMKTVLDANRPERCAKNIRSPLIFIIKFVRLRNVFRTEAALEQFPCLPLLSTPRWDAFRCSFQLWFLRCRNLWQTRKLNLHGFDLVSLGGH